MCLVFNNSYKSPGYTYFNHSTNELNFLLHLEWYLAYRKCYYICTSYINCPKKYYK